MKLPFHLKHGPVLHSEHAHGAIAALVSHAKCESCFGSAEQGIDDSGMRLAVLTCLARMLEIKCDELEGEEGTGPMERDQQILEAMKSLGGQPSNEAAFIPYTACVNLSLFGRCMPAGSLPILSVY